MPATSKPATEAAAPQRYHHGDLPAALLQAAETILQRDGLEGLTLRAAAREAGVSHAAPKNHFGDIRGLLSELAAIGFRRLRATMTAELTAPAGGHGNLDKLGIGYVKFAKANPALFTLMFRSERLDFDRPALKEANRGSFSMLSSIAADAADTATGAPALSVAQAAHIAAAWSLVHGFVCLMLDGRLRPLLLQTAGDLDEIALIQAIMSRPPSAPRA